MVGGRTLSVVTLACFSVFISSGSWLSCGSFPRRNLIPPPMFMRGGNAVSEGFFSLIVRESSKPSPFFLCVLLVFFGWFVFVFSTLVCTL